ncbi:MAG: GNAT family N-acetyltransferase [Erysipelotrichaceae bacterium]|nr:GNAT family N-acetyltransferase [Erysipelotrichaceae bacterium]
MKLVKITDQNRDAYNSFRQENLSDYMSRIMPDEKADELYWYYIEDNDEFIGAVWIEKYDKDDFGKLGIFIADEKHRHQGIGTQAIEEIIRLSHLPTIILNVRETNLRALHVYQKCGFQINRHYTKDNGVSVIEMIKSS